MNTATPTSASMPTPKPPPCDHKWVWLRQIQVSIVQWLDLFFCERCLEKKEA